MFKSSYWETKRNETTQSSVVKKNEEEEEKFGNSLEDIFEYNKKNVH